MSQSIRVRFAPSPTGPLHIGGVRTALYNYLFARKHHGTFILRIEDTDQARYVDGAEQYILDSLDWLNLRPDESVSKPGKYGPYRQSERREIYRKHIDMLLDSGHAYYAFDSSGDLEEMRKRENAKGVHSPKYDQNVRMTMKNSLTLDQEKVSEYLEKGENITVRMKVPEDEIIEFSDRVRGEVRFNSGELDDKVIMKADGLPTYHLANVVDDRLMAISHVIRGEEWLSSTAHHVLLYRAFGWEKDMPEFAHLPLILKPSGKGKLSKRDGAKFGFPVFPLRWHDKKEDVVFEGFREAGFLPSALLNFISLLGWNPGTDEEIFTLEELCQIFALDQINKSGAQFNYDKAKWFNQQFIMSSDPEELLHLVQPLLKESYDHLYTRQDLEDIIDLLKPRVEFIAEFVTKASYFFESPQTFDEKTLRKKYRTENSEHFGRLTVSLERLNDWTVDKITILIKEYIQDEGLKFGDIFPVLRVFITGDSSGPDLFIIFRILGKKVVCERLNTGLKFIIDNVTRDA